MSDKTFEQALEDLGTIVASMESGDSTLDESLKNYETGIKLSRFCKKSLDQAEKKVEVLVKKADGSISTEEFEKIYPSENKKQEDKNVAIKETKKETKKEIEEEKEIKVEANNVIEAETTVEAERIVESETTVEEKSTVISDLSDDDNQNTAIKADEPDRNLYNKEEYTSTFEEDLLF